MQFVICLSIFFVMLFLGVPIAFSIILAGVATIVIVGQTPLAMIPSVMFTGVNSFIMLALPMFVLVGRIMERGGSSKRIFNFANSTVGWMRGGLGAVNIVSSMIFGGISGSSVADAGSIGKMACNEMSRHGYPKSYSGAVSVASSTLSIIIPPSIVIIMLASVSYQSVGQMLAAGLFPGILFAFMQVVVNYFISKKNKWGDKKPFSIKYLFSTIKDGALALITPIILLGGIFSGIFTATEGAAIGVLYCIIISLFIFKDMKLNDLWVDVKQAAVESAAILLILCGSNIFNYILIVEKVPNMITNFALSISPNPYFIVAFIVIILLIVGMIMDIGAAVIMLTPIFLPIGTQLGFDPIHFGIVMVVALAIGLITPPVAPCLMALCSVTGLKVEKVAKELVPYIVAALVAVIILIAIPEISLFLPRLLYRWH